MDNFQQFTNLFNVTKTIQLKAVPQGKTLENMQKDLDTDKNRATAYSVIKPVIADMDRSIINDILSDIQKEPCEFLNDYYNLWDKKDYDGLYEFKNKKDGIYNAYIDKIVKKMEDKQLFGKELPKIVASNYLADKEVSEELQNALAMFKGFTSADYLYQLNTNRQNMYSNKESSNSIAKRIVDDNMTRCFANYKVFSVIRSRMENELADIESKMQDDGILGGTTLESWFEIEAAGKYLTQTSIDMYNEVVGGRADALRSKVKGFNEYINEYNQAHAKEKDFKKLPLFKKLYKQVLSESIGYRFAVVEAKNAYELLDIIKEIQTDLDKEFTPAIDFITGVFGVSPEKIHLSKKKLAAFSTLLLGDRSLKDAVEDSEVPSSDYYNLSDLIKVYAKADISEFYIDKIRCTPRKYHAGKLRRMPMRSEE